MVRKQLEEDLKKAVQSLGFESSDVVLSIPQNPIFGDYSTNIALQLSKLKSEKDKQSSLEIANKIIGNLSHLNYLSNLEIKSPGFINFFVKKEALVEQVEEILGEGFGENNLGKGKKIQVEFISANPTGPLTLANGRGGAIGDTLANVLALSGYEVNREYYVNDTGNQIRLLGESVLAASGKMEPKAEHYQGEYIKELASQVFDPEGFGRELSRIGSDRRGQALEPQELGHQLADYLLEHEIKPAILRLGVKFDEFYSERSIYERSLIDKTAKLLEAKGVAYQKDGALWFKSTEFGDEKDRVLMTSESRRGREEPTYFLADIAHHIDNFEQGYVKRINILGADHHGYGARMKGAMEAVGFSGKVEFIFMQMVKLFKDGKEVRMSKRAGNFVTLDELLDLVGKDVARFYFLMYAPDSHIDFNLDLAKEKSNKNPVFYVQYAHARMINIISKIKNQRSKINYNFRQKITSNLLSKKEEIELIKHLSELPDVVEEIAKNYQVQKLTAYAIKLADLFHKFYEVSPVLQAENNETKEARLALVEASRIVLAKTLNLMGVEAPERM